jgi:hypothetical protein
MSLLCIPVLAPLVRKIRVPLRTELRTRDGKLLGVAGERYNSLDEMLPEVEYKDFPLCAGIDRYARTMFNSTQMSHLSKEFSALLVDAPERRRRYLEKLIEMCKEGSLLMECELWFLGD